MKEQSEIQFYDKLLLHLNKTFLANFRTQELYLDLTRNTRKLRFKSIKNIYYTLTEGKADQIIYHKDKPVLAKSQIYQQSYTKRTCWRVIQKLITKIAYYLTYERGLSDLAPSILKAVNYTRKATDKITNKASFIQFFSQVLDLLIEQNNLLAKKIYALLIDRGYIYSIDQFYKLSRFQDSQDFVYRVNTQDSQMTVNVNEGQSRQGQVRKQQPRKSFLGKRRGYRGSILNHFGKQIDELGDRSVIQHIEQENTNSSEEQSSQEQLQPQKLNKLNHTIHTQIQKVIDQFAHHPNFQLFLSSLTQNTSNPQQQKSKQKKEPIVKQLIKNIRLKNYKANQKILQINENSFGSNISDRKNSYPNMMSPNIKGVMNINKNRTSIASAVNKIVKENIFKKQGLDQVHQLLIRNLHPVHSHTQNTNQHNVNNNIEQLQHSKHTTRKLKRQNTFNGEIHNEYSKMKLSRKKSNIQFFSNAFVFKKGEESNCYIQNTNKSCNNHKDIQQNSFNSFKSFFKQKNYSIKDSINDRKNSYQTRRQRNEALFHNQRISQASRFFQLSRDKVINKQSKFNNKSKFNTAMLQLTAKKYHKYVTEGDDLLINKAQIIDFNQIMLQKEGGEIKKRRKMVPTDFGSRYLHQRAFEVFDRRNRKIL